MSYALLGELKSVRAQSVGEVSANWSCEQFFRISRNESQPCLQPVKKLVTPLAIVLQPAFEGDYFNFKQFIMDSGHKKGRKFYSDIFLFT